MNREQIKKFLVEKYEIDKLYKWCYNNKLQKKEPEIYKEIINETNYLNTNAKLNERLYHIMNDLYCRNKCATCETPAPFNSYNKGYFKYCSSKCGKNKGVKINTNALCKYGCGEKANFIINEKFFCCSDFMSKCPAVKKKNSEKNSLDKNAMFGRRSTTRYTIDYIRNKFPIFSSIEEMKYDDQENILVRCNNCKKWFIPDKDTFRYRRYNLESNKDKQRFYCGNECKQESDHFRSRCDKDELKKYNGYKQLVHRLTNKNLRATPIAFLEKRGRLEGYSVDHKYSIRDGFENNISPKRLSNIKNLEMVEISKNSSKNRKSSISLEKFLEETRGI